MLIWVFFLLCKAFALEVHHKAELGHVACGHLIGKLVEPYERLEYQTVEYCNVQDQPALGSMVLCLYDGGFSDADLYVHSFLNECKHKGFNLTMNDIFDSYDNATKEAVNSTYYFVQATYRGDPTARYRYPHFKLDFPYPVELNGTEQVQGYFKSLYKDYQALNWDIWFGISLTGYWFVVMLIAAFCNLLYFVCPNLVKGYNGKFSNWYRKNISMSPLYGYRHALELQWQLGGIVPTRLETLILLGWFILIFAFCFPQINMPIEGLIENAIGDRFANLAIFTFPLLVLFAGRNNFMQWVTGWSYSRFLIFHRWTARVTYLLILLHAILETVYLRKVHAYTHFGRTSPIVWGYVGITSMSILVFHSLYILRSRRYEIFLMVHIVMAIVTIMSGWHHTKFTGGVQLFYCTVVIWALDRVTRIGRLVVFGIQPAILRLKANETLKVTVKRPKYWKPYPGAHAFIHFLRPSFFWQSHPFTMIDSVSGENTINFYIKVKGGMSHGLYQQISNTPDKTLRLKVLVEGPYHQKITISNYHNVVFLAGGNGIPGMYYEAMEVAKTKYKDQQVKFYWVIRHMKSIEWFTEELQQLRSLGAKIVIFVTRPQQEFDMESNGSEYSEIFQFQPKPEGSYHKVGMKDIRFEPKPTNSISSLEKSLEVVQKRLPGIEIALERPDVPALVEQDIYDLDGSMAFVTCAHPCMVDDVRDTVRKNLRGDKRIELYEQIQQW